jgi:hypothetical protein
MAGTLTLIETGDGNATTIQANLRNTAPTPGATTGDRPITAMTTLNDGRAVAGIYYITFASVVPGSTATCKVSTSDSNNPYKNTSGGTVALNDPQSGSGVGTRQDQIIGGVGLYFSNSANFSSSWTATVVIGGYFDAGGTETQVTSFGILTAGTTSSQKKIGVKNTGDQNCEQSILGTYPGVYYKHINNSPVYKIRVSSKTATAGKYVISCSNYNGGVSPHTVDVYVTQYAYNSATDAYDTLVQASTLKASAVNCDIVTEYTTIISGTQMTFNTNISGGTQVTNVYLESATGVEIAPDVTGSPGSWTSSNDVTLTESGGGTSGRIQPNNTAYFWVRVVTSTSDSPGNLRKFILRPLAVSIGGLAE